MHPTLEKPGSYEWDCRFAAKVTHTIGVEAGEKIGAWYAIDRFRSNA